MFKDERIIKIYGLFCNSACAAATAQGMLIPFFCLILRNESLQEQLRLSSLIMVIYGFGATFGGQILGQVNDRLGGSKAVSRANIFLHFLIYGSLFICNEIHEFGFICFFASFWIGVADSSQMTQLTILISDYIKESAQAYAILNLIKTMMMAVIIFIASSITTKDSFRSYFIFATVFNCGTQLIVALTFKFENKLQISNDKTAKDPLLNDKK